jgi:dipeptidyl aminopeptidase/acylaminoacyl peptidase
MPKGFDAVRTGKRGFTWRSDSDSELYWVEAADGGDPNLKTEIRDKVFRLKAPFEGEPQLVAELKFRYNGITWGNGQIAIISDAWWKTRKETRYIFSPENIETKAINKSILFDLNTEDRYANPGNFVTITNERGFHVLLLGTEQKVLFMTGEGASPRGDIPFLSMFNLEDNVRLKVWESEEPYYESPITVININKKLLLTRRESKDEPPNYCLRDINKKSIKKLTDFQDPYPMLENVEKKVLRYKRDDGVDLTADLYLPPNYKEGQKLPVLMWAYPSEFKSKSAASQVKDSPYRFMGIGAHSPLFWLTQGYAVLDDPSMPIIGEGKTEPNDTYVQQLQADAKAVVNYIINLGIADPGKIAFGGHSYGAFTTANLLAHTDLFAAGIARSGAYNRTLTPFGFQSEERTFWEAPVPYIEMSPFMFADRIKEPILIIHGAEDNNSGTFPMQSERFFSALKGHGATARFVVLPKESHGYMARESILHMLWEMNEWLNKFVKNK